MRFCFACVLLAACATDPRDPPLPPDDDDDVNEVIRTEHVVAGTIRVQHGWDLIDIPPPSADGAEIAVFAFADDDEPATVVRYDEQAGGFEVTVTLDVRAFRGYVRVRKAPFLDTYYYPVIGSHDPVEIELVEPSVLDQIYTQCASAPPARHGTLAVWVTTEGAGIGDATVETAPAHPICYASAGGQPGPGELATTEPGVGWVLGAVDQVRATVHRFGAEVRGRPVPVRDGAYTIVPISLDDM
jgi:hypothetical protein